MQVEMPALSGRTTQAPLQGEQGFLAPLGMTTARNDTALRHHRLGIRQHAECEARWQRLGVVDAHRRRAEVRRLRLVDVRNERLWIAIDEREPCALHLYHQPVARLERVEDVL